jgi:hypothetical protein
MPRKPEPDDFYGGPEPAAYRKRGEVWRDEPEALPEGHPVREAWVARIAAGSTPIRELGPDGEFQGWINPDRRKEPAA